jgi:hypothetical protein
MGSSGSLGYLIETIGEGEEMEMTDNFGNAVPVANVPNISGAEPPRPKIPASIAKAIVRVMQAVATIEKDAENKHGNYKYASVDSVYEGVQKAMAEAGIVVIPMEESVEKLDDKLIKFVFSFLVATETDTWEDPRNKRTVYMQWMGPQTFQGGQSYCEKAFLKGLFKLNTGEPEQEAVAGGSIADDKGGKGKKAAPKAAEPFDEFESERRFQELAQFLSEQTGFDAQAQDDFSTKHSADIQRLRPHHADSVRKAFAEAKKRKA